VTAEQLVHQGGNVGDDLGDLEAGQRPVCEGMHSRGEVAHHTDQFVVGELDADEELSVGPHRQRARRASRAGAGAFGGGVFGQVAGVDERASGLGDRRGGQPEPAGQADPALRSLGDQGGQDRGGGRGIGQGRVNAEGSHAKKLWTLFNFVKY
jgi:hypothetical protein